jgi:pimeloyl-ACP methyl ester carboxylesterase
MLKRAEDAVSFVLHYDPRIAIPFRAMTPEAVEAAEAAMWQRYDAIRARTLVIRGAESDLLSAHTAEQMSRRGPRATLCELPGVGHAPTLIADDQIGIIREFLS